MVKSKKTVKKTTKPKSASKGAKKKRQEMVDYIIKKLKEI